MHQCQITTTSLILYIECNHGLDLRIRSYMNVDQFIIEYLRNHHRKMSMGVDYEGK